MKHRLLASFCVVLLIATSGVVLANTSTGRGQVTDHEGNPLQGAEVTFRNTANETAVYTVKTNKKGRYIVDSLLYYATGDWKVSVSVPGYVPTYRTIESRSQTALIVKDDEQLGPGKPGKSIPIRPFGTCIIDWVLTPEDLVQEQMAAAAAAAVAEGGESAAMVQAAPRESATDTAYRMASSGDLEGSLEFFDKAAENEPDNAELMESQARVLYQLQRYDDAETAARRASAIDELRPDPYKIVYSVQVSTGDLGAARETLDELRAIAPQDPWVYQQIAYLASESGSTDDAIAAYEGLTELDPSNTEAWVALGGLYADAGRSGDSAAAYAKVVELDPENAYQTFFNIGALIENQDELSPEDNERAITAFRKAIEIKPDYALAHRHLAYALLRKGDLAGARDALEGYLAADPDAQDRAVVEGMIGNLPD